MCVAMLKMNVEWLTVEEKPATLVPPQAAATTIPATSITSRRKEAQFVARNARMGGEAAH